MLDANAFIPGSCQDEPVFWDLLAEWPQARDYRTWPGPSRARPYIDPFPQRFAWFTKAGSP